MTKANARNTILTVGFRSEEVERLSGVCTDAEILQAESVKQVNELMNRPGHGEIDLMIVSTLQQDERSAVMECVELRDQDTLSGVPLLAAISRYQIGAGKEIEQLRKTDYIIQPIESQELGKKMQAFGLKPPDE